MGALDFGHIVTGTDFSETSKGSVREALRLAASTSQTKVSVVHVASGRNPDIGELEVHLRAWVAELDEAAVLSDHQRIVPVVATGNVAEALARYAAEHQAGLIVVGPLAHTLFEKISGGPAEQLFGATHTPILVTRRPSTGYEHILVPVDFSRISRRVLGLAADLARDASLSGPEAALDLVHVYRIPGGVHGAVARRQIEAPMRADLEAELRNFAAECGVADVTATYRCLRGVPHQVIPQDAASCRADLVCMGSVGTGTLKRAILGSSTSAVLSNVDCPLLVVWP